jgi:hypothetical protein
MGSPAALVLGSLSDSVTELKSIYMLFGTQEIVRRAILVVIDVRKFL